MTQLNLAEHLTVIKNYAAELTGSTPNSLFTGNLKYDGPSLKSAAVVKAKEKIEIPVFDESEYSEEYRRLCEEFKGCKNCGLSEFNSCADILIGRGGSKPKVMFVGKSPKLQKIAPPAKCEPFSDEAGEILLNIAKNVLSLTFSEIYLTNIVKCVPTDEVVRKRNIDGCKEFTFLLISILKPKFICALGNEAVYGLIGDQLAAGQTISVIHGQWFSFRGIPLIATFNPGALLHSDIDNKKRKIVWADMKKLKAELDKLNF